jgi:hypothetical protein
MESDAIIGEMGEIDLVNVPREVEDSSGFRVFVQA